MCPYKFYCNDCVILSGDETACARYQAAAIRGIEAVPQDLKAIDYHLLPKLCRQPPS